ncbi:MAG TPA: hypothetical protein DHV28_13005 [Ignavibacteriales bacterium]|nr:hypothetical protein [Ignavibacteriales bacterium]
MKILALFVFLSAMISAQVQNDFSHFKAFAGDYKSHEVLEDKTLKPILKKILGKEYNHFITNLDVIGSVDLISGGIVLEGNAPHNGGEEMAKLDVNLYNGVVTAAIFSKGKIDVYTDRKDYKKQDPNNYMSLPISIKDWIALIVTELKYRFDKPTNLTFK